MQHDDRGRIIFREKPPRKLGSRNIELPIFGSLCLIFPVLLVAIPTSEYYNQLSAIVTAFILCIPLSIYFIFRWISLFLEYLIVYKNGIQVRSPFFFIKRYIPYEQISELKIVKRDIGYKYITVPKYPVYEIIITTEDLRRYEIWTERMTKYNEACRIIIKRRIEKIKN